LSLYSRPPRARSESDPFDAEALREFGNYGVVSRMASEMYQSLRNAGLDTRESMEQTRGAFFRFREKVAKQDHELTLEGKEN
jgi:hypothetical protein